MKKNGKMNDLAMFVPVQHPFCVHAYAEKKYITNSLSWISYGLSGECALCSPSLGVAMHLCSCNGEQRGCNKQFFFFLFTA